MDDNVGLIHSRSQRANRGSRMAALMRNDLSELEEDEFWGKGGIGSLIFKEDEVDQEFEDKEQLEDISDSDIDISEDDEEEEEEVIVVEKKKRSRSVYQDPAIKKQKVEKEKKIISNIASKVERTQSLSPHEKEESKLELRRSTLQNSARIKAKIEKEELEQKKRKKVKKNTPKKVTQQERLRQIKHTEKENSESLLELMKYEEEIKKVVKTKYTITGPVITYISNPRVHSVIFSEIPDQLLTKKEPYPKKLKCAITGKPAKYVDPITKLPYYDLEAFKILREKYKDNLNMTCIKENVEIL